MLKNLNAGIIRRLAANSLKSDKKKESFSHYHHRLQCLPHADAVSENTRGKYQGE